MRYTLFLGCTAPVRSLHYELSARRVARTLGCGFVGINGFECCGYPVAPLDHHTTLVVAVKDLSLAEEP
jgi:heterodisulfide reductase subunit B